jgi:hypothetical protein
LHQGGVGCPLARVVVSILQTCAGNEHGVGIGCAYTREEKTDLVRRGGP